MRRCSNCLMEKALGAFSYQFKNPTKLYAWCDDCRGNSSVNSFPLPKKGSGYSYEVKTMRDKARQLRKFDDAQVAEIRSKRNDGMSVALLAQEYKASQETVRKAIRGYKI